MPTTIHSIAEMLDVSPTTVSMALNGNLKVAEKTRKRVQDFAAKCGFVPNESARNFRLKKSSLVAIVVYDISSGFWTGAVSAIEAELGDVYSVILCNSYGDLEREKRIIETLRLRKIAGLVITPASTELEHLRKLNEQGVPVVLFERTDDKSLSYVKGDDIKSVSDTVEMCLCDGHRRIAIISSRTPILGIADRISEFRAKTAAAGVGDACKSFVLEDETPECLARSFLPEARNFSAVLCVNDNIAAMLLVSLRERGIRSPEDLSVISWNNSSYLDYLAPPLSSIKIPVREMGTEAAQMIMAYHAGSCEPVQKLLKEEIVFRQSYRPLRQAGSLAGDNVA